MKRKQIISIINLIIALLFIVSCEKNKNGGEDEIDPKGHPRLLLFEGEEEQIRDLIDSDETWEKMHLAIIEKSTSLLGKPELERVMVGRRLLSTSREFYKRIFYLSYAYRMTVDERYLKKAVKEMEAVARFDDWNPSHFLDVAEMTMGMAIGYDWLFTKLTKYEREEIRSAILFKGIYPSQNSEYTWWLTSSNNWNQVCNTGMVYGVLAIEEDYPELADEIIERAFQSIPISMEAYQPDGVYPEGYNYWGYGTTYNVLFLSVVEKYLNDDKGLTSTPGFLQTANFLKHMVTPSDKNFSWSDTGTGIGLNTAMFWFAERTGNPSVLWSEKEEFLGISNFSKFTGMRELPAVMIWGKNIPLNNISEPDDLMFVGQGPNPVCMMRSSWTAYDALYLGFKAGSPEVNHGHMDVGSFVMESDGVRWAGDLGMQNYESLESKGMEIFGKTQDAERWTVFRMNSYSHNVLTVDGELQRVNGYAKIDKYSEEQEFRYAISDVGTVYRYHLNKAKRGVAMVNDQYVVIQDEIETLDKSTSIRWNMLTYAQVNLTTDGAMLVQDGKQLYLKVNLTEDFTMKTWSTAPTNDYDAENPGTIMVGFECEVPANSTATFEVLLIPSKNEGSATFLEKKLDEW